MEIMAIKIKTIKSEELYKVMDPLYRMLDELMDTLAPEGWNNSPYHFPFVPVAEEHNILVNSYEVVAEAYQRQFGLSIFQYIKEAKKDINIICKPNPYEEKIGELVYLIEFALVQLTENGLFYKNDEAGLYYTIEEQDIEDQSYKLGVELELADVTFPTLRPLSNARQALLFHIDLSLLYTHILQAFAQINYDWRYRNEQLEYLWIRYQIAGILKHHDGRNSQQEHLKMLSRSMRALENNLPPDEVIGYLGTYDKLPIGYPPTIEDIKELTL